jgi:hypothetical protein
MSYLRSSLRICLGLGLMAFLATVVFYAIGYYGAPKCNMLSREDMIGLPITAPSEDDPPQYLVSYAQGQGFFETAQKNHTIMRPWFDMLWLWQASDLDPDFREEHAVLLSVKEGAGLWVWKPQVIKQAWAQIPLGAVLVYLDGGLRFKEKPVSAIQRCVASESGVLTNADRKNLVPLRVRCKGALFRACGVSFAKPFIDLPCVEAGFIVCHKRTEELPPVLAEWLRVCTLPGMLSAREHMEGPHPPGFRVNYVNHDQSIWSLLAHKHHIEITVAPRNFVRQADSGASHRKYRWRRWWRRAQVAIQDGVRLSFR